MPVIGQGATAKIYRDGNTAIKLYEHMPIEQVEAEAARQRFAYDAGLPVPAVYGVQAWSDGRTALEMEYAEGHPLVHPGMSRDERNEAICLLAEIQRRIHEVHANDAWLRQKNVLAWKINRTAYLEEPEKQALLSLLARLTEEGEHDRLCHGDLHSLNIIRGEKRYWVIDWVDATAGSPFADACRTYLICKQYMSRAAGIYLSAFCKTSGFKKEDVLAWLPVIAAARLDENMDEKTRTKLLEEIISGATMNEK